MLSDYIVIPYSREEGAMKARLVQIGNSRGIRLPKPLIEQAGLDEDVELLVRHGGILIEPVRDSPRSNWKVAAQRLHADGGDQLIDPPATTDFDEDEWEW
jgi:antitoxin MazE